MDYSDLEKLGLNKNEAKIFISLLKKGSATAGRLIKDTEFHRNIVYDNLEKLIDKGLVTFIISDGKKLFQAKPPTSILDMIEKQEKLLEERRKVAQKLLPEIKDILASTEVEQKSMIYRGVLGIKYILKDVIETSKEYFAIGVSKESEEIMSETFWKNFHVKRKSKRIKANIILNYDFKSYIKEFFSDKTIKFYILPKKFKVMSETLIYNDKVAIIVFGAKPVATLIEDKIVSDSYKKYFNLLAKNSQRF